MSKNNKDNNNIVYVIDYDDNDEALTVADKARKKLNLKKIGAGLLATIIIAASLKGCSYLVSKEKEESKTIDNDISTSSVVETQDNVAISNANTKIDNKDYSTDYSQAEAFYETILDYRSQYGENFANEFSSVDDVIGFLNFVAKFDPLTANNAGETLIQTREQFENIVLNYYTSCAQFGCYPQMSLLFKNNSYYNRILSESELLISNLKNESGTNYENANAYYEWCGINLCDLQSCIKPSAKANAPLIEILIQSFIANRGTGTMYSARMNEKNDCLNINGNMNFSCPDSIDNTIINDIQEGNVETYSITYEYMDDVCSSLNR